MSEDAQIVVGLPWFREKDWPAIKRVMADAKELHDTYEEWLKAGTELEVKLTSMGQMVEHVPIDPAEFADWCRRQGVKPNGKARARYASEAIANWPWRSVD